jgi:sn-glycerol 3-phosphate transport system substrate-binding protein
MKKGIVLLLLLCVAIFQVFSNGGQSAGGSAKTKVAFWEMYGPGREIDLITAEYNKAHSDVEVEDIFFPTHSALLQRLQTSAAAKSGDIPDVVLYDGIYPRTTDQLFPLVDLREYFAKEKDFKFEDFYPPFQATGSDGNRVIALHAWSNCLLIYYNKALFRKAGLDPNKPPTSWSEMYDYARKIRDDKNGVIGFTAFFSGNLTDHESLSWEWQAQVVGAGGQIYDKDWKTPLFNTPIAVEALEFYTNAIKEGILSISPPEEAFINGLVGIAIQGSWMGPDYTDALGADLGVAVWPGKLHPAPCVGGEQFMIVKSNAVKQQAAWDFVKHWFTPKVNLRVSKLTAMNPTYAPLTRDPEFKAWMDSNATVQAVNESFNYAIARPARAEYPIFSEIIHKHFQPVMYLRTDPRTAVQAAYNEIVATIK